MTKLAFAEIATHVGIIPGFGDASAFQLSPIHSVLGIISV